MKKVLVTGATGFLGRQLAIRLAGGGTHVHALYRDEKKIHGWSHPNLSFFRGTLGDSKSIERAMEGCREVYHLAAVALPWVRDFGVVYEENVGGTVNVLEAARKTGVEKLVYTSTAGVLGPSDGQMNTEDKPEPERHFTHYDCSKAAAEKRVRDYARAGGQAVIVNPTRIFGPGNLGYSNFVTRMIARYLSGKWRVIPGDGSSTGNYVFVEDVVDCLLFAMERGRSGERYIAGGTNLSFNEFFEILRRVSGVEYPLYRMPYSLMMAVAGVLTGVAYLTGWPTPITPGYVQRYHHNWSVSIRKAERELGYRPMGFEEALGRTIEWIKDKEKRT